MMVCQTFSRLLAVVALAASFRVVSCDQFLAHSPPQMQYKLLSQLEGLFGQGLAGDRLQRLENRIRPVFAALPKDANGRLDVQGARYALHRYFSGFHGVNIEGLNPKNQVVNNTSPMAFLEGRVSPSVQDAIDSYVTGGGLGLRDVSMLAAVTELLIQTESMETLRVSYEHLGVDPKSQLTQSSADQVLSLYYSMFILRGEGLSMEEIMGFKDVMQELYAAWDDTMMFVQDVQGSLAFLDRRFNPFVKQSLSFDGLLRIVESANDRYGKFQNEECSSFKGTLLEREYHGTGRVLLSDFYAMTRNDWRFSEKREYLRDLGALDESDPAKPSVIVANYLTGTSNCFVPSNFYSVCCLDECEDLLGHLERTFATPDVEPARILDVVKRLSSSTVAAPRNISTQLVDRLHQIASFHGGSVPLHGRLFAQWMHHAYPRECPYPHVAGTIKSVSSYTGVDIHISEDEAQLYWSAPTAEATKAQFNASDHLDDEWHTRLHTERDQLPHLHNWREPAPWTEEEEFFAGGHGVPTFGLWRRGSDAAALLRQVVMVVIVLAMVLNLVRMLPEQSKTKSDFDKYCV